MKNERKQNSFMVEKSQKLSLFFSTLDTNIKKRGPKIYQPFINQKIKMSNTNSRL